MEDRTLLLQEPILPFDKFNTRNSFIIEADIDWPRTENIGIDFVAYSPLDKRLIVGECKYSSEQHSPKNLETQFEKFKIHRNQFSGLLERKCISNFSDLDICYVHISVGDNNYREKNSHFFISLSKLLEPFFKEAKISRETEQLEPETKIRRNKT